VDGQLLGARRGAEVGGRRRRELTAAAARAEPRAVQLAAEEMLLDGAEGQRQRDDGGRATQGDEDELSSVRLLWSQSAGCSSLIVLAV